MKLLEELTTSAVEHPLITVLAGLFISLLGFFGLAFLLPIQQEPPVKIPVIIVSVPYPGASPAEVEAGEPVEALLAEMVKRRASDLLLVPGSPPTWPRTRRCLPSRSRP